MQTAYSVKLVSQVSARLLGVWSRFFLGHRGSTLRNSQFASVTASRFSCGTALGVMTYPFSSRKVSCEGLRRGFFIGCSVRMVAVMVRSRRLEIMELFSAAANSVRRGSGGASLRLFCARAAILCLGLCRLGFV